MATDTWINLDTVGITTEPFAIVASVAGGDGTVARNYIFYFEGTA
jgi:hypothetical protein